jgi:hypothetical protein
VRRLIDTLVIALLLAAICGVALWADTAPLDSGAPPTGTTAP